MQSSLIKILLFVFFATSFIGCKDDTEDDYVIRDTDKLNLSYAAVSSKFTVRVKGGWDVSSDVDWLTFSPSSGVGNGKEYQYVDVEPLHNKLGERTATIYIKSGSKVSEIAVVQQSGLFEISKAELVGALYSGVEAEQSFLAVNYKKAQGTEKMSVEVKMSGDVTGVEIQDVTDEELHAGDNSVMLPITGTPDAVGALNLLIQVKVDGVSYDPIELQVNVISPNIILSNYFDKMVWGGDYINNKAGIKSSKGDSATPYDSGSDLKSCPAGDDGTNNMFGNALRAAFVNDPANPRGVLGWDGWGIFERPGYIKMGTATYSGWIATPPLDLEKAGGESDIFVSFDYALFDAGISTPFKVEGAGITSVSTLTASSVKTWKRYVIKIAGAKTGDVIVWGDNSVKGKPDKNGNIRYMLDNIEISAEMTPSITTPLTVPTNIQNTAQTGKSLTFSWDEVADASAYKLQLSLANNPSFLTEVETGTTEHTFDNLMPGTKYILTMMAIYSRDENMNSPLSTPLEVQTVGNVPKIGTPTLQVLNVTHGKCVVGWDYTTGWEDVKDRRFHIELAKTATGNAIRSYDSESRIPGAKYKYNRFVFAGLDANTTYYCRVKLLPREKNKDYDESDVATIEFRTLAKPSLGSNVIFFKDFEDFSYGADGAWGAFGVMPVEADMKTFVPSREFDYTALVTTNTVDNISDSFNTGSTSADYKNHRWGNDVDWPRESSPIKESTDKNYRIYEVAGYLKFGGAKVKGRLTTPVLSSLSGTSNIKVSMKACPYTEPNATTGSMTVAPAQENSLKFMVTINGAGTIDEAAGATTIELVNKSNNNSTKEYLEWTDHAINITGANATTSVTIETLALADNYRMWLDDVKIETK